MAWVRSAWLELLASGIGWSEVVGVGGADDGAQRTGDPGWWRRAVVYQIYQRSFADANADGIGDLEGITSKVPYVVSIGVDVVWVSPSYPSALADGGYDVDDYRMSIPGWGPWTTLMRWPARWQRRVAADRRHRAQPHL
jgi:hypothetical protein